MALTLLFAALLAAGLAIMAFVAVRVVAGGLASGEPPVAGTKVPTAGDRSEARRILDERFARGEITTDEYRERVRALEEER